MIFMNAKEEIEFRKKIHKKNTLRAMIKEKKALASKLSEIPECKDEYFKLQSDIKTLEEKFNEL